MSYQFIFVMYFASQISSPFYDTINIPNIDHNSATPWQRCSWKIGILYFC